MPVLTSTHLLLRFLANNVVSATPFVANSISDNDFHLVVANLQIFIDIIEKQVVLSVISPYNPFSVKVNIILTDS